MLKTLHLGLLVLALLAPSRVLTAQTVLGRVFDAVTTDGVGEAEVTLADSAGRVVARSMSERSGRFLFRLSDAGIYVLTITRLGYSTGDSAVVHLASDQTRYLEIELQPEALGLPGFTVRGDPQLPQLELSGFYHRRDMGRGRFLDPGDIQATLVIQTSEYLRRVPFVRMNTQGISYEPYISRGTIGLRSGNSPCYPDVVLDGMKVREGGPSIDLAFDNIVSPHDVEAMEVYAGGASIPRQWLSLSGCGLIVIWTKR